MVGTIVNNTGVVASASLCEELLIPFFPFGFA